MAYVPGDEIPVGSLGDDFRGFSLKKIGKAIGKGVKDAGKFTVKAVKVAAPIAAVAATGIVGGVLAKKGFSAIGGALKKKPAAVKVAVPAISPVSAEGTGILAQIVNATTTTETAAIDPATGQRTNRQPFVQRTASKVLSASAKARDEVTKRQQQTRDTARRLQQVAEIAKGTPAEAAANRAAQVAENVANTAQGVTNTVRQVSAGVDGAIVGAGSGVAAEEAQQGAAEFFRSSQGLYVIGAGVAALVLLSRKGK